MNEKVIVVGELHLDLYYETDFYEELVNKIVERLFNFIRYNPDDLQNKRLLERLIKGGFSDTPKKIIGTCFFKRGGNGNNSSEYLANLGSKVNLVSVIGRGSDWMYSELKESGINTDAVFQIDEITPVSTIIESNFTTKIFLAPNLKNKMNFDGITVKEDIYNNAKIIFSTPIARKFIFLFEKGYELGLITAYNIETQKVRTMEKLNELIKNRYDLFFLNLKDARMILNANVSVEEADEKFKKYAYIRIYTAGSEGSCIITDNFTIHFPGIEVSDIIDRTGAGDCFAAGFLTILHDSIENKDQLHQLLKKENSEQLKTILASCGKYATFTAIYKITKQLAPTREKMDDFIKSSNLLEKIN